MLRLVIHQRPRPNTRFLVHFRGESRAFNTFADVKEWIHFVDFIEQMWESSK